MEGLVKRGCVAYLCVLEEKSSPQFTPTGIVKLEQSCGVPIYDSVISLSGVSNEASRLAATPCHATPRGVLLWIGRRSHRNSHQPASSNLSKVVAYLCMIRLFHLAGSPTTQAALPQRLATQRRVAYSGGLRRRQIITLRASVAHG